MDVSVIFKIAAIGIIAAIVNSLLKKSGKDEIATVVSIAAIIIVVLIMVDMVSDLFLDLRTVFKLY